jgi:hypothetical protein
MDEKPRQPADERPPAAGDVRLILVGVAFLLETTEQAMYDRMEVVSDLLQSAAREVTKAMPDCKPTDVISYHYLGDEDENAVRCAQCGEWGTDDHKPKPIDGIASGLTIDGQFLCHQCRANRRQQH